MPRGIGLSPLQIGPAVRDGLGNGTVLMGIPFLFIQPTVAGTTTYTIYSAGAGAPRQFRVIQVWGVMTGAGGAGDTVVVDDGATAITNTVSVAALADQDTFDFAAINDAQYTVVKGGTAGNRLRVVTASDALCDVHILCVWTE